MDEDEFIAIFPGAMILLIGLGLGADLMFKVFMKPKIDKERRGG